LLSVLVYDTFFFFFVKGKIYLIRHTSTPGVLRSSRQDTKGEHQFPSNNIKQKNKGNKFPPHTRTIKDTKKQPLLDTKATVTNNNRGKTAP
jgi:hypothetical protein